MKVVQRARSNRKPTIEVNAISAVEDHLVAV